ncbi:MAG: PTS sugar transporter subunit IIA [Treponema sp.]|jgi:PTS system nitrogen regulatory IIA component|nr:PTS sugar transporter subunit IIA [Treponema sp.]
MIDDDILTIDEVAKYLRVSERTVYEWAQKGEIPSGKIGAVWRFKKSEIESWVNDRLSTHAMAFPTEALAVETVISPDRILILDYSAKRDVLLALANNLANAPQVKNRKELVTEILKREELMTTAMGRGIAIPHVRLASVTDLIVSIGINQTGISDFHALDDEPVRLVFMVAAAYNQHAYYLQTISFFSARLKKSALRRELLAVKTPDEAYRLLAKAS